MFGATLLVDQIRYREDTRQLALVVMAARGLDTGDKVLAKAVAYRLIHILRLQARGGKIVAVGWQKAARVWRLPNSLV
jgi:hypothetical protein